MFCGTAFKNKGIQPLLDAVVDYLPSPIDRGIIVGSDIDDPEKVISRKPSAKEPFAALAFKIINDRLSSASRPSSASTRANFHSSSFVYNPARASASGSAASCASTPRSREEIAVGSAPATSPPWSA